MKIGHPVDCYVGTRVRAGRMRLGMSQEKLGEALGITFQQVQKYEKGSNRISCSRLVEIARVLGLPVAFFFEGLPDDAVAPTDEAKTMANMMATRHGAAMAAVWPEVEAKGLAPLVLNVAQLSAHGPAANLTAA
ncbi:helix-turn-helix domain-containing protein [Phreatobacter oligotrophus]|uniref:Helix-turn-helix protein n=1 Tax=Phreatobacter oligotrophus TaxID=1122261 RepID=A0A2T4ZIR2_9HYPH|nr:helix-turn-helix transcriptional regulator [Phreatobacter oligotrophus]PTM61869.1 helix-turn-helix protein [Phreatobacter oligotrophus]